MRLPVLTFLLMALAGPASAADRPNIIFIMSDDHAAHAISAYGSRVNTTPSIDRLAREGMRFDNVFVTNSICTPSRAAILTGQYSHRNGVPVFNRFDSSRQTVARLLQAGGYYTGMIGKWHLGSDPAGFDDWEILPGQGAYLDPLFYTATGEKTYTGRYVTDVITDLALDFIRNRPAGKPFFLMMHHKAPHRNWVPEEKYRKQFENRWIPEPPTLWDTYVTRTDALHENQQRVSADLTRRDLKLEPPAGLAGPDLNRWLNTKPDEVTLDAGGRTVTLTGEALTRWKYQRYMQDYLATVQSVDDSVGRVLGLLDSTGLSTNTIVIYTSDQGFFLGDHGLYDKRFMYEECLRMPFLVRWPSGVKAGEVARAMALNVDFAPTFLEAAGLPVPADMQGRSLVPVLKGQTPGRLADVDVLPLLPRPGRSQHAGALRRPHHDAQAHLVLEERPVGAVRPGERSARTAQPLRPARPRADHGGAESRIAASEAGARRRGSVRPGAAAGGRGRPRREAQGQVARDRAT